MLLPTISTPQPLLIPLEPLTPTSFAPFGSVITSPLPRRNLTQADSFHPQTLQQPPLRPKDEQRQESIPTSIPPPLHPTQPTPIYANQSTALKTSPISPLLNTYPPYPPSKPLMSLFTCFPRPHHTLLSDTSSSTPNPTHPPRLNPKAKPRLSLPISILERHPYTTQTFSPLGLSASDSTTHFIVVVAPSLPESSSTSGSPSSTSSFPSSSSSSVPPPSNPPDLLNLRAFLATGNQAVTYDAGTWHAPMVVLGLHRVDFLVVQFVNGVAGDDCQEVNVRGVSVDLDVGMGELGMDVLGEGFSNGGEDEDVKDLDNASTTGSGLWERRRSTARQKQRMIERPKRIKTSKL